MNSLTQDISGRSLIFIEASLTGSGLTNIVWALDHGISCWLVTTDYKKFGKVEGHWVINQLMAANQILIEPHPEGSLISDAFKKILRSIPGNPGVICVSDRNLLFASKVAEYLGAPFIKPDAMLILRDKVRTRKLFDELKLPNAKWLFPKSVNEVANFSLSVSGPLVLKNTRGTGSLDVKLAFNSTSAVELFAQMKATGLYLDGEIMLEEYLRGMLISVEVVVSDGVPLVLGFTDRQLGPLPDFCEVSYSFPVEVPSDTALIIQNCVETLCAALEITNSIMHIEFIITRNGPILVEVNPRIGGGQLSRMISNAFDVSAAEMLCRVALGKMNSLPTKTGTVSSTFTLYPDKEIELRTLDWLEGSKEFPYVDSVIPSSQVGDVLSPARDYRGAVCQICTSSTSQVISLNCAIVASQFILAQLEH